MEKINFQILFDSTPGNYLILAPDARNFTILEVNRAYNLATNTDRSIIGKRLFDVFPDNPNDIHATGVKNLTFSLNHVLSTKTLHKMAVQKYDIPLTQSLVAGFEERYWSPQNSPVLDENNNILYIIHCVVDVTKEEKLKRQLKESDDSLVQKGEEILKLAELNRLMVSRELKMVELKKELDQLKAQCDKL